MCTDHVIFKGEYWKISLCFYGYVINDKNRFELYK